jgi:hypothetical protein
MEKKECTYLMHDVMIAQRVKTRPGIEPIRPGKQGDWETGGQSKAI